MFRFSVLRWPFVKQNLLHALFPAALLFSGACAKAPAETEANFAPHRGAWVRVVQVPADPSKEELLPTYRLHLENGGLFNGGLDLVQGVDNLCGIDSHWIDDEHLLLRVPARQAAHLALSGPQLWQGIDIRIDLHEDQVRQQAVSPDGQRRLVVIADCQHGDWNVYLRRAGEPNFNAAMDQGWDDPDVFGGFSALQPVSYLRWTGPRSAEIGVPDKQYGTQVREKIGDVTLKWKFLQKLVESKEPFQSLKPLPPSSR